MREMKDSGIEWIGEIPNTWKFERLQWHLQEVNVSNNPIQTTNILSLTNTLGVIPYEEKGNQGNKSKENCSDYKLAYPNTIVANSMNVIIGSVGISKYFGCISPVYYVFREKNGSNLKYINYVFQTVGFQKELRKFANGILEIRLRISASNILKRPVPFPGKNEQQQIVDFLDAKCSEIDSLAADIQTQIDTLEQYKRSVITEAVTKGIDKNVALIDGQIPWIMGIPKHWRVIPAKYLFHNSDTRKFERDEQLTASQKYGIVTQKEYMERENAQIVLATKGIENWKHVEPNDFVISLRSFQGGLEMSETTGCITWHYVVIKASKPICHRFYKWLFKSSQYINALQGTCNFIRDGQDLRFANFAQVPLYEPTIEEQQKIANYLDTKCSEIGTIIEKKREQLATLDAYKKSLIYEYVTGKKEVPVS